MLRYILYVDGKVFETGAFNEKEKGLDDVFMYLNEYCKLNFSDIKLIIKDEENDVL